ncbi:MAG: 50S ribosomal protein L6 [Candidatus Edwardsbacteria bacterium]
MSRVGKKPISIPEGVKVEILEGIVRVTGPKGFLEQAFHPNLKVMVNNGQIVVQGKSEDKFDRALHGLTRTLLANAIKGVIEGYQKELQIYGVGYRAEIKSEGLNLLLGYSQPIFFKAPPGIKFEIFEDSKLKAQDKVYQLNIKIMGIDKQLVGETAAKVRAIRPAEPYQGKGIRYLNEIIRRKAGKAAATKIGGA